jgi:RIO kinase 1
MPAPPPVVEGQFDDPPDRHPEGYRQENNEIVPEQLEVSSESDDDDDDDIHTEESDDDFTRVEDEDWEIAERGRQYNCMPLYFVSDLPSKDFTKQYNRLRQHLAVNSGNAQGVTSAIQQTTSVVPLPAVNRPKAAAPSKLPASDQLLVLAKYSSRLAKIDVPYVMGVGVNRKGPSSYANMKDKSDRATNEQVLDPRTRIILFKMIGRGLIHEVNGCVSTGKEVRRS